MIKILHLSDIHMGSGFSHGRINPETGLNTRLEDFAATLSKCMDRAISEPVDLVIFGGDAFPDSTPAPFVKEAFARQFSRLVDAQIPTVLLVGNHDQHSQGQGGASLGIYRTLGIPKFIVGDRLDTHLIQTRSGPVQVVTLPWLTRSTLMTRSETESLSVGDVNQLLTEKLTIAMEGEIRRLNPDIPTVLLAHLMADKASLGAERFLAVDKGFVLVNLERGKAEWEFCTLPVRVFQTIKVNVSESENPQAELVKAIGKKEIQDAVVRLIYQLRSEQLDLIDNAELHALLGEAHSYTIQPELVSQLARPRLPELNANNSIEPLEALKTYLASREDLKDVAESMLEAAQGLLGGAEEVLVEF